jgi:hypothetical protein
LKNGCFAGTIIALSIAGAILPRRRAMKWVTGLVSFCLLVSAVNAAAPNSLIASWSFDSVSGKTFYDVTGHGYTAVGSGDSIGITDGLLGKALDCRGTGFDVYVNNSANNFNLVKYSVEAWVYSYVNLQNIGSFYNFRSIFDNARVGDGGSGIVGGYAMEIDDRGVPYWCAGAPATGWVGCFSDSMLLPNQWYHLVSTYDGATMKMYVDGKLTNQTAYAEISTPNPNPARIGCQYMIFDQSGLTGAPRNWFTGKIDEMKVYNYALDSLTVAQHYNTLKPATKRPFKINFGMRIAYCNPGDTVWMPIYLTNFEDYAISACQFNLHIDTSKISLLSISKDSGLVKNWLLDWNRNPTDTIKVGLAGTAETIKYGEGEFVRCKFQVRPTVRQGDTCLIRLEELQIDETFKLVSAQTVPGKIIIAKPKILYGDVTGDGNVTVFDARDILSEVVDMIHLPDQTRPNFTAQVADVSGNGAISSYDAALVFQYSVGMLPEFPVMRAKTLPKRLMAEKRLSPTATLSLSPVSQSASDGMKFNLIGTNLNGFVAGDFVVSYNPSVANVNKGTVITTLRMANLISRLDTDKHLLRIAMTDDDDICTSDPVVLATITLPPNSTSNPAQAFTLAQASINEGQIQTNVSPITPIAMSEVKNTIHSSRISYRNSMLKIQTGSLPVCVRIFSLNGRLIESKRFEENNASFFIVNFNRYHQGTYIYDVVSGNTRVKNGKIIIGK